jgi:hypothetical protein
MKVALDSKEDELELLSRLDLDLDRDDLRVVFEVVAVLELEFNDAKRNTKLDGYGAVIVDMADELRAVVMRLLLVGMICSCCALGPLSRDLRRNVEKYGWRVSYSARTKLACPSCCHLRFQLIHRIKC